MPSRHPITPKFHTSAQFGPKFQISNEELCIPNHKTAYGPNYNNNYVKKEDLSELHDICPKFLYIDDIDNPEECNYENRLHILDELQVVAPKYFLQEHFETNDGTITIENSSVKYLGIYIDNKLKFDNQIAITNCKISRLVHMFWNCPIFNQKIKKQLPPRTSRISTELWYFTLCL